MSTIRDLVQFADRLGQRKIAERRYQDQRNMQLAQIASAKDKENKVMQSQRFLNDAVKSFSQTGWNEDGTYTNKSPNKTEAIDSYLANMDSTGQAGDRFMINQQLSQVNSSNLMADAQKLTGKVAQWEAEHADEKGDWKIFGGTYEEDKKAYLKKIGADKLYASLHGLGGTAKAMELTGLTPDSFDKKDDSWLQFAKDNKMATGLSGAGAVGSLFAGKKLLDAAKSSIEGGIDLDITKGKGQALIGTLEANLKRLEGAQPSPEVSKNISLMNKQLEVIKSRGHIDPASWKVLDNINKKIPEGAVDNIDDILKNKKSLSAAEEALKGMKGSGPWSKALRYIKKVPKLGVGLGLGMAGYTIAKKLTSGLTDAAVGEEDSTAGKVAGVAGGTVGGVMSGAAISKAFKTIGDNISKKGTRWAITRVMKRGGPALAAKFVLKAGIGGITTPATGGLAAVGTVVWLASDAFEIAKILSEDE